MNTEINKIIIETLKPFGLSEIGVFGSYSRNEMTLNSDIDILYDYNPNSIKLTLFDLSAMKINLEEKLKINIDLTSKRGLKEWIIPYVMKDLKIIYEKN